MNQAVFRDSCGGPWGGKFKYKNDSGEKGSWTVMRATASSVNAIFVQMASKIDQCEIKRLAESIGVHNASGEALSSRPVLLDRWLREQHRARDGCGRLRCDRQPGRLLRADHHRQPHRPRRQHASRARPRTAVSPRSRRRWRTPRPTRWRACSRAVPRTARTRDDGTTYIGKTGTTDNAVHVWLVGSSTAGVHRRLGRQHQGQTVPSPDLRERHASGAAPSRHLPADRPGDRLLLSRAAPSRHPTRRCSRATR